MGILTDSLKKMTPAEGAASTQQTLPEAVGAGLRSGTLGMGSQLASLGGAVANELGATGASQGLYDKSTELRMRAAEAAPRVQSVDQVGSLRDALEFGAGTVGQALPSVVPAVAAGVATRNAGLTTRLLAPAATFAPLEAGDVVQRQQAAGQEVNLRDAALIGGGSAALQSVVPGVVGAKLAGRAAAPLVAGGGLRATAAKNIAGAALGEGATEAGGEAFKQLAMGQDLDAMAIRDNAIAGALGGAALGAPGAVGDVAARGGSAARGAIGQVSEKVGGAAQALKSAAADTAGAAVQRVGEAVDNSSQAGSSVSQRVLDTLGGWKDRATGAADRISQGKPLVDDPVLAQGDPASPEFQARVGEMDKGHASKAREFADGLLSKADEWLTPERRDQITQAAGDLGDAANRATVAGMQKARQGYDLAKRTVSSAADELRAWAEAKLPAGDGKQTKAASGLSDVINRDVVAKALTDNQITDISPEDGLKLAGSLVVGTKALGLGHKLPGSTISVLDNAFGERMPAVMEQVFARTHPDASPAQRDAFYKGLNDVLGKRDSYTRVVDKMGKALLPEHAEGVTTGQLRELYTAIREWDARPDRGTAEDRFRSRQINEAMQQYFGDKADAVLEDVRKSRIKEDAALEKADAEDGADFSDGLTETDVQDPDPSDPSLSFERQGPEQGKPDPSGPLSAVGVSRMRFKGGKGADDRRTSKSAVRTHPEKPDTDVFDAIKMTEAMHKALPRAGMDEKSNLHRTARMFSEATARLQEKLGRTFEVPDDTVISKNGITWGKAKAALEPEQLVPDAAIHDARERMLSAKSAEGRMFWADVLKEREDRKARMQLEQENETTDDIKSELVDLRDAYTQTLYERNGAKDSKRIESLNKTLKFLAEQGKALEAKYGKANLGGERFTYGDDAHGGVDLTKARYADDERTPQADRAAARHMAQEARTSRADMERENPGDMGSGATEVDPMGQIHQAMAAHGKRNFDEKGKFNNEIPDEEDGFKRAWHSAGRSREGMLGRLSSKISQMESATYSRENKTYVNKPAQALGAKARELFGKFDQLKEMDQAALLSIVQATKPSEAADTINGLTAKYAAKPVKDVGQRVDAIASKEAWDVLDTPEKATAFLEAAAPRLRELGDLDELTDAQKQVYKNLYALFDPNADLHMFVSEAPGFFDLSKTQQDALLARVDAAAKADPEVSAQRPKAQLEARARSGDPALSKEIARMQDAKSLQRALDHLNGLDDRKVAPTIDDINARIGELAQDPDVAYNLQTPGSTGVPRQTRADVQQHIEKVLGPKINVAWKVMGHEGEYTAHDDTIRVAVHSLNPMGTAYHESLHAWFKRLGDHGANDVRNTIMRAASSDHVLDQIRARLKGEPDALKQLNDAEERAAYMYQFWAQDPSGFKVPAAARGTLDKIAQFFRKVLGIVSNDDRALHILERFHAGEYAKGDYSFVNEAETFGKNNAIEKFKAMTSPIAELGDRLLSAGSESLRDTGIPALRDLADAMKLKQTISGNAKDPGFIPAARAARTEFINRLGEALKGASPEQMDAALGELQGGPKATDLASRVAVKTTRKFLDDMLKYMQDAGVRIEHLGIDQDYFPRVYDTSYIASHRDEFRNVLKKHGVTNPDRVVANLITAGGNEFQVETMKPGMQFAKERQLKNIPDSELQPFTVKDYAKIMSSYVNQATRRAEWARRLGDDGKRVTDLLAQAKDQGATPGQLSHAADFVQGVDGTLGDGLNPQARKLMGNMIVYQNVRLLPMAIFSSIVDPVGIAVRGGSVGDAFTAFKRGVKELPNSFRGDDKQKTDFAHDMAEMIGTIESATLNHVVGDMYSESMTSDWVRKVNDKFFKYNMMEGWNRSMRVAATQAAIKFIAKHADGTDSMHSKRWMAELGLESGKVPMKGGEPDVTNDNVKMAVQRWVDGAVLRPDAADKPVWMNDPHYALIAHLKQFVYAFNETILKRALHEARWGNMTAAYALASYVPIMIAADAAKGMLLSGGDEPEWKRGWTASDYVYNGMQRAGLFGVGQFGLDAQERGLGALTGPTIEQLSQAAGVAGGHGAFGTFALNAMPASALVKAGAVDGSK